MKVSTAIYIVKPTGQHQDLMSMPIKLNLPIKEPKLFASEEELTRYVQTRDEIDNTLSPTKSE
jgi:hypothetical protein